MRESEEVNEDALCPSGPTQERKEGGRHSSEEVGRSARMVDTSWTRVVKCGTSADTWRATLCLTWRSRLGWLCAELG
jgi:hypothetical protein